MGRFDKRSVQCLTGSSPSDRERNLPVLSCLDMILHCKGDNLHLLNKREYTLDGRSGTYSSIRVNELAIYGVQEFVLLMGCLTLFTQ